MATHWVRGEEPIGTWTILVKDSMVNENNGSLNDWRITLWGEAIDAGKTQLLPLPGGEGDNNLGTDPVHTTTTASFMTTNLPTPSSSSDTPGMTEIPTDHADRPINSKPTGTSGK